MVARTRTELERLLLVSGRDAELERVLATAGRRAETTVRAGGGDIGASGLAAIRLAAEVLAGSAPGRHLDTVEIELLVDTLAAGTGLQAPAARLALYDQTLRALQTSDLPPGAAIEALLGVLVAFAPVIEASLWLRRESTECVAFRGGGRPTRRVRAAAYAVLGGEAASTGTASGPIRAVPVLRWGRPLGALVVKARLADRERALTYTEEAAATLAPALVRETDLERGAEREAALVQASERRLTRIGFDIHDGPLQDIAALAADLRLFRAQLGDLGEEDPLPDVLGGRLDDFDARLVELDRDLRELAHSLESPSALGRPLAEVLRRNAAALEKQAGIIVAVDARGDPDRLTPSQRLALVRVVQEALTNVREHSGARRVSVRVTTGPTHTEAVVVDDGRGFEVERTLVRAARRGRLGLVGMGERVRLLGGRLDVESRPGGPTTIVATIPRWEPLGTRRPVHVHAA